MHRAAHDWVASCITRQFRSVVEHGGRNINGSVRHLFPGAAYTSVDIEPGDGVDVVADAAEWRPAEPVDCVVCCEVYEHTAAWPELIYAAFDSLTDGGVLICTAAGPNRQEHSAVDGGHLRPGEWYANIDPGALEAALKAFSSCTIDVSGPDVRAVAVK